MRISAFTKRALALCAAGSISAVLCCCGGGGDDEVAGGGPTRLFPDEVMSGTVKLSDERQLELVMTYNGRDYTQGVSYSGSIQQINSGEGNGDGSKEESQTIAGNNANNVAMNFGPQRNMTQSTATTPGRLVFLFADDQGCLQGTLVLNLPASGMNDYARLRTGTVDSASTMYFSAAGNGNRTRLNLSGAAVTVTWGN